LVEKSGESPCPEGILPAGTNPIIKHGMNNGKQTLFQFGSPQGTWTNSPSAVRVKAWQKKALRAKIP
jgi:hypothetical protein